MGLLFAFFYHPCQLYDILLCLKMDSEERDIIIWWFWEAQHKPFSESEPGDAETHWEIPPEIENLSSSIVTVHVFYVTVPIYRSATMSWSYVKNKKEFSGLIQLLKPMCLSCSENPVDWMNEYWIWKIFCRNCLFCLTLQALEEQLGLSSVECLYKSPDDDLKHVGLF